MSRPGIITRRENDHHHGCRSRRCDDRSLGFRPGNLVAQPKATASGKASDCPYYAYYNFCRVDQTLRVTPAMEAGLADHIWPLGESLVTWFRVFQSSLPVVNSLNPRGHHENGVLVFTNWMWKLPSVLQSNLLPVYLLGYVTVALVTFEIINGNSVQFACRQVAS